MTTLANSAPVYERPWFPITPPKMILPEWVPAPNAILTTLKTMMSGPALSSRRWIWEQYDHMVMGDTVQRPGGDAAVVRIHGTQKGLALTCDVTPRYVAADPAMGTKQAVVETWRNLTAVGADPLAITDNMNFANPERPEVMGQFVGSVKGMAEACRVLDYPVVSGNVSLYNETNGVGIPPTPAIGGVGLDPRRVAHGRHQAEARERPAHRHRPRGAATSASRSTRSWPPASWRARRRPSTSPTRSRPAASCAR